MATHSSSTLTPSTLTLSNLIGGQRRARAPLAFLDGLALARARVHEFCGPARQVLGLLAAGRTEGPVIWIRPDWIRDGFHPEGVQPLLDPARLILVTPRRAPDLLWCMEEALRAGAAALVLAELPEPPGLTPVRRLHLAAETGAEEGRTVPTGLVLTPGDGGAAGVESRWHLASRLTTTGGGLWQLERRRARAEPPRAWLLRAPGGPGGGLAGGGLMGGAGIILTGISPTDPPAISTPPDKTAPAVASGRAEPAQPAKPADKSGETA